MDGQSKAQTKKNGIQKEGGGTNKTNKQIQTHTQKEEQHEK